MYKYHCECPIAWLTRFYLSSARPMNDLLNVEGVSHSPIRLHMAKVNVKGSHLLLTAKIACHVTLVMANHATILAR